MKIFYRCIAALPLGLLYILEHITWQRKLDIMGQKTHALLP